MSLLPGSVCGGPGIPSVLVQILLLFLLEAFMGVLDYKIFTSLLSYWATSRVLVRATNRSLDDLKKQLERLPSVDGGSPTAAQMDASILVCPRLLAIAPH